jgi:methyl-accepting chemotaxis protein
MNTVTAHPYDFREPGERTAPAAPAAAKAGFKTTYSFDNMSIPHKLLTCFVPVMVLTGLIGLAGYVGVARIGGEVEKGGQLALANSLTAQFNTDVSQTQLHAERFKASGRAAELSDARDHLKKAGQGLEAATAVAAFNDKGRDAQAGTLKASLSAYDRELTALGLDRENSAIATKGEQITRDAQALKDSLDSELAGMRNDVGGIIRWTGWAILGLMMLWIMNSVAMVKRVSRDISGRAKKLTQAMLRLVEGEKNLVVPDLDRVDEFGDMARSLEVFRRGYLKLDQLREEQARASQAELERQAEEQREKEALRAEQAAMLHELANQFERTVGDVVGGVAAASTQLQLTASSMAAAAEQAAMQTTDVSNALSEASGGVTAAAAASDEFAMSIGEISRQAATSAELARKATLSAADADATISTLSESAQQVGQIVELISTIAQRTNLLALNASIEAARGGEAGRGFAVVASEVKELAAQTSKATDEVAAQIRAIQESTGASVTALRAIGQQVEQLEATSVSIAAAVDQQSVAGQDLARSIDLAARSTDDVSSNIIHVRETSLATGAAASQVLTSSTELEQQAVTLKSQVEEFLSHVRAA